MNINDTRLNFKNNVSDLYNNPVKNSASNSIKYGNNFNITNLNNSPSAYFNRSLISFEGMKKSQFKGIDLLIVNQYNGNKNGFNINNFNSEGDLQEWCKSKLDEIKDKIDNDGYKGRTKEATVQRKEILKEWYNYVTDENDAYTPSICLFILDGITKPLKPHEDKCPPILNQGALADTIDDIQKTVKQAEKDDKEVQINFNKQYNLKLSEVFFQEDGMNEDYTGWIKIPSETNDPDNFESNVEKLKQYSHHNWCTKSYNAKPYLSEGDFHVYMENGKPKIGVRFIGNRIQEIQGEKNNTKIPVKYLSLVKDFIKENNFKLLKTAKNELKNAEEIKKEIDELEQKIYPKKFKDLTTKEVFDLFNFKYEEDENGMLSVDSYDQPNDNFTFDDIEIDENKLFKHIKEIKGRADFEDSKVTNLGNLQSIGGIAFFGYSNITNLGNLQSIGGRADFRNSKITDLGNLQYIGGNADFEYSNITNLGNLKSIGRIAWFSNSNITNLGKLQSIGGNAYFTKSNVTNLGNLQSIGGDAYFRNSKVTNLGNLQSVGGRADFEYSNITNLGNLQSIGGDAYFRNSKVTNLGNLQSIGGDAGFARSKVTDLGKLQSIGRDADFRYSKVTHLGKLQTIGRNADFTHSNVTDLGELQNIGGDAYINRSPLTKEMLEGITKGRIIE